MGARDNTSFAQDDSLQLVVIDPQGSAEVAVVRTLRGEHVRTIYAGERGLGDTDDRGLRFVGRDHFGWFRGVAGQGIDRFRSGPYARIALNGPGTRIAAIGRQFEVVSFDTGDILVQKNCPRAVSSCSWVAWDLEDPDVVWLATGDGGYVRWNLQTDETARFARDPHLPIRYPPESAYSWPEVSCRGGDAKLIITRDTIDLVENGQQPRRVVTGCARAGAARSQRYRRIDSSQRSRHANTRPVTINGCSPSMGSPAR